MVTAEQAGTEISFLSNAMFWATRSTVTAPADVWVGVVSTVVGGGAVVWVGGAVVAVMVGVGVGVMVMVGVGVGVMVMVGVGVGVMVMVGVGVWVVGPGVVEQPATSISRTAERRNSTIVVFNFMIPPMQLEGY